jgi:hypothetical protein
VPGGVEVAEEVEVVRGEALKDDMRCFISQVKMN